MYNINDKFNKTLLFSGKSTNQIESLISNLNYTITNFKKNEVIFSPNKVCDKIGVILSGSITIKKILVSGESLMIGEKAENDLIGINSVFSDIKYYPFSITAKENTDILVIYKNNLNDLLYSDKELMFNFVKAICCDSNLLNNKIDILSQTSIKNKIIHYLICEYDKHNSLTVNLPYSKKTWAEFLHVQTPSLSRSLRDLEEEGLIKNKNRTFYLLNIDRLREVLY